MSILTNIPDGFYESSRIEEQLKAVNRPTQFSLQSMMLILTLAAAMLAATHTVLQQINTPEIRAGQGGK
jgi:hypothetical protein